jgi:hypothetical protein
LVIYITASAQVSTGSIACDLGRDHGRVGDNTGTSHSWWSKEMRGCFGL